MHMDFQTIILRFRDLVTEENGTIKGTKMLLHKTAMYGGRGGKRGMRLLLYRNFLLWQQTRKLHQ